MKRRPPSTAARRATVRCTEVGCPSVRDYGFNAWLDRKTILAANAADPWRCGRHPQEQEQAA